LLNIKCKLQQIDLDHLKSQPEKQPTKENNNQQIAQNTTEKILCPHCRRTATNGIKCKGMCVADSDY
jgi:hypothetical protein